MQIQPKPDMDPGTIACELCLKEIPRDGAINSEVEGYVAYFCGLECYETWSKTQAGANLKSTSDRR